MRVEGTRLGPYVIDRELGSGGMGTVYRATGPDGVVALKIVHDRLLAGGDATERFRREVEIGKTVRHPNVVSTFDGGEIDGQHYLAMEYVEGQTLAELLVELERVPEELCRHIGHEVSSGLAAIHAAGAIHRDMKPENVLITPDYVVKIMDLGVARSTDDALRLSQTGMFVGSLHYAAPEQFQGGGKGLDGRADLHALGLVLYELASGVSPYYADEIPQVVRRVLHEEPRKLGEINPQLSAFFEEVVHCLLAKDREGRFADAEALRAVLDSGEDSAWWRRRASMIRTLTKRPLRRVRIPRETAVYGREDELKKLRALYDAAKSGDGNVVLIEGEAGIGKSRLIDELIGRMQRDGEDINFLFGSYPPGGAATAAGGFSTAYREQFGADGCAEYLTATPVLVPAFDALLRGEPPPKGEETLTKDSLQTCFVNATRALGAERQTVVLIDDLHFAPDEGRALFTSLAMAAPGHRVLLIGTTRPGVSDDWTSGLTRLDQTSHVALNRLGPKDLVQLLEDTLQSEQLARELGNRIAVKSDGNPFFVFEILRGLREGQFITQLKDGSWVGTQVIDDIQIPSSVLDLVNARVADLSEEERDLLDVASCWGFEFDPALIADVLGLGRIPTLKRFGQLERAHRLVRAAGRKMVFDHHQVQEALYGSLLEQLREEYHAALAEALETRTGAADTDPASLDGALCVDLCRHYLKGARGESALRYLPAARSHLAKGYVHGEVVALTERALAVPGLLTGSERAKTLLRVAAALDTMGRRARQEECAREAGRLAAEGVYDGLRGEAANALGKVLRQTGRHGEAEAACRRTLEFAIACGDRMAEANARSNLGVVSVFHGRLAEAREHHERDLALSRQIGDPDGEARARGGLGSVSQLEGRLAEATEHHERCLALRREIGDRIGEAAATVNLGNVLLVDGRLDEAREHYERGAALCGELGHREYEANATGNLGHVFLSQGRLAEAEARFERRRALACEMGDQPREISALGNLGIVFLASGRLAQARAQFERCLALSCEAGDRTGEALSQHNLGELLREAGEPTLAEERLLACLAVLEEIGDRRLAAVTRGALGSLRAAAGDEAGAREAFAVARDVAAQVSLPGCETHARCELACLPGGDAADALAAFAEHDERLDPEERREARRILWKATGDRAHLEEAKRLLDEWVAHVDEKTRTSMLTNLRRNREIMAAWKREFGDDDPSGGESPTRVA